MLLVLGSCIVDFSIRLPRLPQVGETVIGDSLVVTLGGKGANQAIGLRRLGAEVQLITCVGNDSWGQAFVKLFADEGIVTSSVFLHDGIPTGIGVPLVLKDGRNAIVVSPSAALDLSVEEVLSNSERFAFAEALLLQLEGPLDAFSAGTRLARQHGIPIFLNPAPWRDDALPLCREANVLIPNQNEAEHISGMTISSVTDALNVASRLRKLGPEVVIITLGEQGSVIAAQEVSHFCPAFEIEAVDTTAAGDAFCAGLVYSWSRERDWQKALQFANACGASASMKRGAIPSLPCAAAVELILGNERSRH